MPGGAQPLLRDNSITLPCAHNLLCSFNQQWQRVLLLVNRRLDGLGKEFGYS
jgi:hypothetical protein